MFCRYIFYLQLLSNFFFFHHTEMLYIYIMSCPHCSPLSKIGCHYQPMSNEPRIVLQSFCDNCLFTLLKEQYDFYVNQSLLSAQGNLYCESIVYLTDEIRRRVIVKNQV